jgi:hypothetical protein
MKKVINVSKTVETWRATSKRTNVQAVIGIAALLLFASCDEIKEATSRDVEIKNFKLTLDDLVVKSAVQEASFLKAAAADRSFGGTTTFSLASSPEFSDFKEYGKYVSSVNLTDVTIKATLKTGEGTTAINLHLTSTKASANWSLAEYAFGESFKDTNLTEAVRKILVSVFDGNSVDVTGEGLTDATEDSVVKIEIIINGFIKVSLL